MNPDEAAASEERVRRIRAQARKDYPAFYSKAGSHEAAILECLIASRRMSIDLDIPLREFVPHPDRLPLERKAGQVDQIHASLCEAVRVCPAFRQLDRAEQQKIEELFRI